MWAVRCRAPQAPSAPRRGQKASQAAEGALVLAHCGACRVLRGGAHGDTIGSGVEDFSGSSTATGAGRRTTCL